MPGLLYTPRMSLFSFLPGRPFFRALTIGVLFIAALIVVRIVNPFTIVNAGDRGVVLTWGAFNGRVLEPGLHFRMPVMQHVVHMNVQETAYNVDASDAYTTDGQSVQIRSSLLYTLDSARVGDIYQNLGLNYELKIIRPFLEEAVKTEVARFAAIQIPTNRPEIAAAIEKTMRETLAKHDIIVTKYTLVNEDFSESYEKAISDKQVREQEAQTAEFQTKIAEQQKQQKILEAQAQAESIRIQAEALAKNRDLVQLKAVEKWDGHLPQQMIPGSTLPFIQLNAQ